MPGSPGIFNKNDGDTIYAADFNNIQSATEFLLGTGLADSGYGQTVTSAQVTANQKISVSQWNSLRSDLLKIRQHQTGVDESGNLTIPLTSSLITNEFVNQYKAFSTVCQTNRLTIASTQGTEENLYEPSLSTRTTAWNGVLTHTVTINFSSANQARFYFNAGGQIRFSASRSGGSAGNKNTVWTQLLNDMGEIIFNHGGTTYTGTGAASGYPATSLGWYTISTTPQTIFIKPAAPGVYAENDYNIRVSKNANDNTATSLTFVIEFRDDDTGDPPILPLPKGAIPGGVDENVDGTLVSRVKLFRPTGANVSLAAPSFTQSGI
jgi:hypothetical protein